MVDKSAVALLSLNQSRGQLSKYFLSSKSDLTVHSIWVQQKCLIHRLLLPTSGQWCQFNVNRNSQFVVQWRRKLFSANSSTYGTAVITAWLRRPENFSWAVLLCSAPLCSTPLCGSAPLLLHQSALGVSALPLARENTVFNLSWKGKMCSLNQRGAGI